MGLLKKKRKKRSPRGVSRIGNLQVGCAFCWEPLPLPQVEREVFTGDGCLGGRCACGAVFVVDETGREGGLAQLDVLALLCDGDLDRAIRLDAAREVEFKTRDLDGGVGRYGRRAPVRGQLPAKIWFARFTTGRQARLSPSSAPRRSSP
jgi:hypothetical protein